MKINSKKKILVVKICCIGDIVQSIPLLRTIKKNEPNSIITHVATTWCSQLVEMIPEVDRIIVFDAPYEKNIIKKSFQSIIFAVKLILNRFDVGYNLHRTNVWNLFFKAALIKKRVGFGNKNFLTDSIEFREDIHESKRYLDLLKTSNYNEIIECPVLIPSDTIINSVKEKMQLFGIPVDCKLIALFPDGGVNPGTDMRIKQLSLEKYIETANILQKKYSDLKFIIMKSKEQGGKAEQIFSRLENTGAVLLSDLSLQELAGWFSISSIVIGGDTGLLHMAAATGTPVIQFYGPSSPELVAPLGKQHKIIYHKTDCSPCYTPVSVQDKSNFEGNVFGCKRKDVLCMESITVEEIVNAVDDILNKRAKE